MAIDRIQRGPVTIDNDARSCARRRMFVVTTTSGGSLRLGDHRVYPVPGVGIGLVQVDGTPWGFIPTRLIADVREEEV